MSAKPTFRYNALMESFYKTLKTELLIDGKFETEEKAKNAIFEYIEIYYNRQRLHSSPGYLTPVEFEKKISYLNSVYTFLGNSNFCGTPDSD